jgi:threonine dehydrogenase-like Zn-dependent dehydrogenase
VFAEPLAVTLHAIARAGGVRDRRVLVIGAGPIGSMAVAAAVHLGAGEVVATDLDADRLAAAAAVGADTTVLAGSESIGGPFDLVFEASGSVAGIADAIEATRKAGTLVLVGLPHGGPVAVPLGLTVARELDVLGSFRFCHDEFVQAVELLGDGLDLSPLLTGTHAASEAATAFVDAVGSGSLKVQLDFEVVR